MCFSPTIFVLVGKPRMDGLPNQDNNVFLH